MQKRIITEVARHTHCNYNSSDKITMKLSTIQDLNLVFPDQFPKRNNPIPLSIYQNIALCYVEEWLHALQHITKKQLAGSDDHDIDVALFLKNKNVELTPEFLDRYNRKEAIQGNKHI